MKIGIITDIHNNIIALKRVLQIFRDKNCDGVICCGDIIGIGAYPEETVSTIIDIPNMLACVKGNHERYLTEDMPTEIPNDEHMGEEEMKHHKWEHSLLSYNSKKFIKNLKYEERLFINNKRIYVSHYAIDKNNRYFNNGIRNPSLEDLHELFKYADADIILYGHEHKKLIQKGGGKYYINCGSLGCPSKDKNIARAGILDVNKNSDVNFTEIAIEYNVAKVLEDMDRINYPAKDEIKKIFFAV